MGKIAGKNMCSDLSFIKNAAGGDELLKKVESGEMTYDEAYNEAQRRYKKVKPIKNTVIMRGVNLVTYDKNILLNAPDGEKLIEKVENGEMTYQEALFQAARSAGKEKVESERAAKLIVDAVKKKRQRRQ